MARTTPLDRFPKLLDAAASAFVEHGFQRTQMEDVADRLGVSKGTVYRAVDSKDELLAAVVEWGDNPDIAADVDPATLGGIATTAAAVVAELTAAIGALELTTSVLDRRPLAASESVGDEIERLAIGVFEAMRSRRTAIMVLDRCAIEIPELAAMWFGEGRYALVDLWSGYLELRVDEIDGSVDRAIVARTIVELLTTWAVKIVWDRAPRAYPDDTSRACAAMIRNLVVGTQQ